MSLNPHQSGRIRLSRGARRIAGGFAERLLRALSRPLIAPALAAFMVAVSAGFALHGLLNPLRTDYIAMLSGARVLADGGCLYCHAAQLQVQGVLLGHPRPAYDPFLETPLVALAYRPLLALSAAWGFAVFLAASALCAGLAGILLWRRMGLAVHGNRGLLLLALALVSVPAAWNYRLGQIDALLVLPLVAGTVLLAADRHFAAGLLLSLLVLKPQTVWLVPVALLAVGEWRVVVGMAVGAAGLAGGSLWLVGPAGIGQWLSLLGSAGPAVSTSSGLPGAVASLLGNTAGFVAAAALGLLACVWTWGRRGILGGRPVHVLALGIAASLLFAPHVYAYDLIVAVVPLVLLARWDLATAMAAAVLLNLAHLVDTFLIVSGPHLAALALCVIVALLVIQPPDRVAPASHRPDRRQLSVASSTQTGA
ncbi:MAG: glycosyltransferase family 87 protein [Candidatus Dormibacteria bacterium]